jgi:small subunit ribosomal protein S2
MSTKRQLEAMLCCTTPMNHGTLYQFCCSTSSESVTMIDNALLKQLLESGAHFGHHTSYWHPKMKKYIFTQRNSIHIIDLEQTVTMLGKACTFAQDLAARGQSILFVGTKKQAQQTIEEEATRCGMSYVNQRWLGGMLTNFAIIQARIDHLVHLENKRDKGELAFLPKKERVKIEKEIFRLNTQMGGFKEMTTLPAALFIADPIKDKIAFAEAKKMGIPVIAIVDTNCNPDGIDYPVPANDDAVKAIKLISTKIADAVIEGKAEAFSGEAGVTKLAAEEEREEAIEILASYTFEPEEPAEPVKLEEPEEPLKPEESEGESASK